jgi:hypothetical protein
VKIGTFTATDSYAEAAAAGAWWLGDIRRDPPRLILTN